MPGREVRVAILGDARDFSRAVDSADRDASRLDGAFGRITSGAGRMAQNIALGAGAAVVAGGALAMSFVRAAEESAQVTRQTEAVLQSMGATAWTTADAVAALSTRLSNQTGIDDELIQSGQNVLLTFGEVQNRIGEGNDIFDRATQAALDMSVALGTDMSSAAMSVGRALNDPIRGLTALRRSGIQFTAQQEEQIRAMVEAGDVAGAQRVMLGELERQFGGSAEAQATASQRLSTMWGNLQEDLGERLLPTFERVADWLGQNLPGIIDTAVQWIDRLSSGVGRVVEFVQANWPAVQEAFRSFLDWVQPRVEQVVGFLVGAWEKFGDDIIRLVTGAWTVVSNVIQGAMDVIHGIVNVVMGIIHGDWSQVWDGIKGIASGVWQALVGIIRGGIDLIRGIVGSGLEIVGGLFHNVWNGIVDFVTGLPGRIASAASGLFDGIKNAFRSAINWIIDRWNGLEFRIPGFDPPGPGPTFPGFTLGMPDIPRLHTGGIFRTPHNEMEGLAILQNGERVSARGSVAADGGGPTVVQVVLDGRVLVDALVRQNRLNGAVPITVQAVAA